ncbi:unnamed protein product [Vitrella brassicaformis CCMP3155]|uniref:Uncharacterized protein n=1 Tax=Vitrella brassicaformis (strain CCMP3155) TaxID=1169540 RepID=A0A0G4EGM7_VITBC|nr:unnamed protein product [Vitrella brassicaformis CCMP3155]|eukprot:CEL95598.1 unnamed protein product [Vitrella brassicaformis CCMP3155]
MRLEVVGVCKCWALGSLVLFLLLRAIERLSSCYAAELLPGFAASSGLLDKVRRRGGCHGAALRMACSPFPILFDCDGVLADTERDAHRPAFNQAFREKGFDDVWGVDLYGHLLEVGGGKERMTAYWNEKEGGWPDGYRTPEEQAALVKELHLRKTAIFNDLINQGQVPLRPGVARIVDEAIAAGCPLAVCSTSSDKAVTNLVNVLLGPQRAPRFRIFAGDIVAKKKPSPDIYLLAAQQMNLDPSKCLVIEDSGIGLKAAKAAGMRCVVTKSSYTQNEDFSGADMVIAELGDPPHQCVSLDELARVLSVGV